jgi:hypothetical protein
LYVGDRSQHTGISFGDLKARLANRVKLFPDHFGVDAGLLAQINRHRAGSARKTA